LGLSRSLFGITVVCYFARDVL